MLAQPSPVERIQLAMARLRHKTAPRPNPN
jgi:hypothetical protein